MSTGVALTPTQPESPDSSSRLEGGPDSQLGEWWKKTGVMAPRKTRDGVVRESPIGQLVPRAGSNPASPTNHVGADIAQVTRGVNCPSELRGDRNGRESLRDQGEPGAVSVPRYTQR